MPTLGSLRRGAEALLHVACVRSEHVDVISQAVARHLATLTPTVILQADRQRRAYVAM
jgi:hypothetical protein